MACKLYSNNAVFKSFWKDREQTDELSSLSDKIKGVMCVLFLGGFYFFL